MLHLVLLNSNLAKYGTLFVCVLSRVASGSKTSCVYRDQCAVFLNITIINDEALSGSARFVLQLR